jgi:hypothetical protein
MPHAALKFKIMMIIGLLKEEDCANVDAVVPVMSVFSDFFT